MHEDGEPRDCPLPEKLQTRNLSIYALNWALIYLASPVAYVGVIHSNLLNKLEFGSTLANLPSGVYLWTTPLAVLFAWYFPQVRLLRPLMIVAFLGSGLVGGMAALAILFLDREWVLAAAVLHAAVWGVGNGIVSTCQWEALGRGVAEGRRGQALAAAFGAGPILAVAASLTTQFLLDRDDIPSRHTFAALFAATTPIFAVAAFASRYFVIPTPSREPGRLPFVQAVFGGAGRYFGHPLILITAIAYILVYSGHMAFNNISLHSEQVLGESPEKYAGLLQALRFGFKIVAGFTLGWLLIRTHPKALLLTTASLTLLSMVWALTVPGQAYLLSFGILGAGELFGVYYPNYILGCSRKEEMRRNMAFTSLITMAVGFAPVLFGTLSDIFGKADKALGFRVSFLTALAILVATLLLVTLGLPARPRTLESDSSPLPESLNTDPSQEANA